MSQLQINHSPDLKRLRDEGFEIEVIGAHVQVHHVPYVNSEKEIKYGTLISELSLHGNRTSKPSNHVIFFVGDAPCNKDGSAIKQIHHNNEKQNISASLRSDRSFSNKPSGGYTDYHHKFTQYIAIISSPAKSIAPEVTAQTFRPIEAANDSTVFKYIDTNSSRAGITALSQKLENQRIAIIGLGGTGSYILDLVAKTSVGEIHIFDGDHFSQHNAFRSPGAVGLDELKIAGKKVDFLKQRYEKLRAGIKAHDIYINEDNIQLLSGYDFVFISIDDGSIKEPIFNLLIESETPFIDVGIGVQEVEGKLLGILRTTSSTPSKHDHLNKRVSFSTGADNAYSTNIQLAELNALNAALAVIKWKKLSQVYHDHDGEHDSTYTIDVNMLQGGDYAA